MNRLVRVPIVVVLIALSAAAPRAEDDREALEARLEAVRAEIGAIQERIDRNLGNRDQLQQSLADAEREVGRARRAQAETDEALTAVHAEIDRLESRQRSLEAEVGETVSELSMQLATAYRQGTQSRLKMLLNQDDPRRLSRRLAYHGYLSRARIEALKELNATLEALGDTRSELDSQARELSQLLAERERETRRLEAAMAEREQALAAIDQRLAGDRERLAGLESDAAELNALLDQLAGVLDDVPPDVAVPAFADLRGTLDMPVSGRVIEAFGDRRSEELDWSGWLIDVEAGDDVRSVAHGRVAYADWLRGYGLIMIIDHGGEYMSLYAHNEALMRDVGDWVEPGELIALSGRSGGVSRPALYFELRQAGRPVDPAGWISR